jgi:penicillin-binding protein 1B
MRFWLFRLIGLVLGASTGFVLPWLVYLDRVVSQRFDLSLPAIPSRIYARALDVQLSQPLNTTGLQRELDLLRYLPQGNANVPGSYAKTGNVWLIHTRPFAFEDRAQPARRVQITVHAESVSKIKDADHGTELSSWRLDPLRIATLFGENGVERVPTPIAQMPKLLINGVQSVEDRHFQSHHGVDPLGLLRAVWTNLRHGAMVQGGSTLTQQLVKNTLLSPEQTLERKLKEMGLALMLERRFSKKVILEAYLNRVVLGQSGAQPVQGFPAASEFYFGRSLEDVSSSEIALLIGLLKATSGYDPRRVPEKAIQRRNTVLGQFLETGLISQTECDLAKTAPLNVIAKASSSRDRYPAFLALVRDQIKRSYDQSALTTQGLSVLTTLDVQVQERAEKALADSLNSIDKTGQLQGAMVLSDNLSGEVLAIVGARDPRASDFNHALDAKRQVGSLLKPFVYLLALSDPAHYALGSLISDAPLQIKLSGGKTWSPQNYDHQNHGTITVIEALAKSYNLATARVGMDIGVDRIAEFIATLGVQLPRPAQPSMILGAVELSPLEVTQLYQALASGGKVLPLSSVRAVMGRDGKALTRYPKVSLQQPNVEAIKLLTLALNETTRSGTAQALSNQVKLEVAGKTGTSNDKRDSWYAGYTGQHLGVVWMGRDDNQTTNLSGATGALKAWSALFKTLPSRPVELHFAPEVQWLAVDTGRGCESFRFLPMLSSYRPENVRSCMEYLTAP